jgi:hypothetical protein
VTGKYDPLTTFLRAQGADGALDLEVAFGQIDRLVDGLPASARRHRPWWANSTQAHALAWQAIGWRVGAVDLAGQRVRFSRQTLDELRDASPAPRRKTTAASRQARQTLTDARPLETVQVCVTFTWLDAGAVALDDAGRLTFPPVPGEPGLYRMTLHDHPDQRRQRIYIGQSDNLHRRHAHYRNPGPTQSTNIRVNARLHEHLDTGGLVSLAVTTSAEITTQRNTAAEPLDLTVKAARLLAENAALVNTRLTVDADLENLD